jgi:hypothetical protein
MWCTVSGRRSARGPGLLGSGQLQMWPMVPKLMARGRVCAPR